MLNVKKMTESAEKCIGWPYKSPGSNSKDGIDCSGLWVRMFEDQNSSIYHGSNTIFYKYCDKTIELSSASQLEEGMAVFKIKKWTEKDKDNRWYGKKPGNLYHIGYVASVNPLRIIQASSVSGEVIVDTKLGKWAWGGWVKGVDYKMSNEPSPIVEPCQTAMVFSDDGNPVKMRSTPNSSLWDKVQSGSTVELTGEKKTVLNVEWIQVNYGSRKGWWIMAKFLVGIGESANNEGPCSVIIENISEELAKKIKEQYPNAIISYG